MPCCSPEAVAGGNFLCGASWDVAGVCTGPIPVNPYPIPGFWMHETSGVLKPAVQAFLTGADMKGEQIAAMRAYLRQWIASPWAGDGIVTLRQTVGNIRTSADIKAWIDLATELSLDPL